MASNPYAPPQSPVEAAPPPWRPLEPLNGPGGDWTIAGLLRGTWRVFRRHWWLLLWPGIVELTPEIFDEPLLRRIQGEHVTLLRSLLLLAMFVLTAVVDAGWTAQWLAAARDQTPDFAHFKKGLARVPAFLALEGLQKVTFGSVGVYLRIRDAHLETRLAFLEGTATAISTIWLALALCFVLDDGTGALPSLARGWRLSAGSRGRILLLGLLSFPLMALGMLACLIGLYPVAAILQGFPVLLYLRLQTPPQAGDPGIARDLPPESRENDQVRAQPRFRIRDLALASVLGGVLTVLGHTNWKDNPAMDHIAFRTPLVLLAGLMILMGLRIRALRAMKKNNQAQ